MPKVNKTMLDKLVDVFKSGSQRKPEIIQATTIRDPLGYSMVQRRFGTATGKLPSIVPDRKRYQLGLDAVRDSREAPLGEKMEGYKEELSNFQSEFEDAVDEAKEMYIDDLSTEVNSIDAPDIRYGFDPDYDLDPSVTQNTLVDYWPSGVYNEPKWYSDKGAELDDLINEYEGRIDYMHTPEHRMELQRQSPRYRRYQDAMQRRDINRRAGRVNAAIMNLARQGYSLPEIREILRRQGR